jgi:hypothetical protein
MQKETLSPKKEEPLASRITWRAMKRTKGEACATHAYTNERERPQVSSNKGRQLPVRLLEFVAHHPNPRDTGAVGLVPHNSVIRWIFLLRTVTLLLYQLLNEKSMSQQQTDKSISRIL